MFCPLINALLFGLTHRLQSENGAAGGASQTRTHESSSQDGFIHFGTDKHLCHHSLKYEPKYVEFQNVFIRFYLAFFVKKMS